MPRSKVAGALTAGDLKDFESRFLEREANILAMNAVTRSPLQEIAVNRKVLSQLDWNFSIDIPNPPITDQKRAATCWLYASLNWLRYPAMKKLKVKSFHFSENFGLFYDKLEKANYFLEKMIEYRDRERWDRHVFHLLSKPCPDGGEWHMLTNIIEKYGLVPRSAMADTWNLSNTRFLNQILNYKLREAAAIIRRLHREGEKMSALRKAKTEAMALIHRILTIMLGEPPKRFDFCWRDVKKKYHEARNITPKEFYKRFVGLNPKDYHWILSCPLDEMPFGKAYHVEHFENMVDGETGVFVNVPLSLIRDVAVKALKKKETVLFGCDVTQESHTKVGVLDAGVFDFDTVFGTSFDMDRKTRIECLETHLTHSMVLTGVDIVKGKPTKWKIENSWGTEVGKKGIFLMSDDWFEEHTFDMVIHKKYLPKKVLEAYKKKRTALPPWHPMA